MENRCKGYALTRLFIVSQRVPLQLWILLITLFTALGTKAQLGVYNFTSPAGATCATMNRAVDVQPANAVFSNYSNSGSTCVASLTNYQTSNHPTNASVNTGRYNEWTITPNTNYRVTLTTIKFGQFASAVVSGSAFWYLRSSLDGFTSNLASGDIKTGNQNESFNLPAATFTNVGAVTFRLYATGLGTSSATWVNDKVETYGVINQIPADPADPTSNSPQCVRDQVTITRVGSPPGGVDWYWQTVPGGTSLAARASTYKVSTSGTYYLRAYNSSSGLWSNGWGTISVIAIPDVGPVSFNLGATSNRCQNAETFTYTANASDVSYWEYTLDGTSTNAGNTIDVSTGQVTWAPGWFGTSTITAKAYGCGGSTNSKHTITTTRSVTQPVFTSTNPTSRCQGAGTFTYTATASYATSVTYSINAAAASGGVTINATTGLLTIPGTWAGDINVSATANGCNPLTTTQTMTVIATVGNPVFALGTSSTRCRGAGTVTYSATATTNTGLTYSLDATSLAAGNTINSATGQVSFVESWFGTSTVTATATGCNGPTTSNHTITTADYVTVPVFAMGSASSTCQKSPDITYSATASNATSITYSLDAASIAAGNTINASTGLLVFKNSFFGTIVVTATANGCSGPRTATHTITVIATVGKPEFDLGSSTTRCQGAATIVYNANATTTTGITYSLNASSLAAGNTIDANTGAVTYAASYAGTSVITASAAGCNGPATNSHTVTVTPSVTTPVFSLGASTTRCQGSGSVTYSATASNHTGITYSLDAASLSGGNTINSATGQVSWAVGWTGTSTITASAAGCNGPATATHTVTITPYVTTPVFAMGGSSTICQASGAIAYTATASFSTGITYSLDNTSTSNGNTINSSTGNVTWAAGWSGTSTITASAAGCSGPRTATHTVTITPTVGLPVFAMGAGSSRCQAAGTVTYTATSTNNTGITYSLDATSTAAGNTINTATGAVTYVSGWVGSSTITATATGCNGPRSSVHTVTTNGPVQTPVFAMGASSSRCQAGNTVTYSATAVYAASITYSLDAANLAFGNTINSSTGAVTYRSGWNGNTTITATASGCGSNTTTTHTVTTAGLVSTPIFTNGATSTRCQGAGTVNYFATANNTTGITYSIDAASQAAGNTINATTGEVTYVNTWSGTTTVTATATGCSGPTTANHVVTVTASVGVPVFALGASSTRCQKGEQITYSASATTNTGLTYSLDAASLAAGNTIDPTNGKVTWLVGFTGNSTITVTATGCNGPTSSTHAVTTVPYVGAPVFALGSSTTRCQGAGSITYSATATDAASIVYTLDAGSRGQGNTINSATGQVNWVANWSGTSTITATASGCGSDQVRTHTVTTTATVGTPVFSLGASSWRCQGAGTTTYSATATTNTGISYSLDATSLAAGNTINSATGAVTFVTGWTGLSYVTATATGCNGPSTGTHTVNTIPYVTAPVFDWGASSTRCQAGVKVIYNASSAFAWGGITYSLDAASVSAGNSISSSTGEVSYRSSYSGISYITATASGCGTAQSSTHAATTTATVGVPVFAAGATSGRCQGANTVNYGATATTTTGITYSLDATSLANGNTINSATGDVTWAAGWFGTSTITASAAGCNGPATANHVVTTTASVGIPVFSAGSSISRCVKSETVTYSAAATTNSGLVYSLDQNSVNAGNTIRSTDGRVTWTATWVGTSTVTVTASGCNGPTVANLTINTIANVGVPVFSMGTSSTRCQGAGPVVYGATASDATNIVYTLDASSRGQGNTINSTTGQVNWVANWSGTSTITATASGCGSDQVRTHTVTTTATVGNPVFSLGASSGRCRGAGTVNYSATSTNSTGMSYSLDASSLAAGNTINSATGAVTYVSGWTGTSYITASATGCNGPATSVHAAVSSPDVLAPTFDFGANSTRCQLGVKVVYSATAPNATSITYSLDAAALSANNSFTNSTGELSYKSGYSGTAYITATAFGCGSSQSSTHIAVTTPTVGATTFSNGATSTRCQGANTVTYTANATNNTGITYTIDAASTAAGNSIHPTTGALTFAAGWVGNTTITATSAGCNGPTSSTHTVTTIATVGTPVFSLGASSTRCQGGGNVTYTASATTTTGITYSLDAASLAAGNLINSSTGQVSYNAGFNGTAVITASAAGCNGPAINTHTVTITPTVGTPVFALGSSSARCRGAETIVFTATSTNSTSITYTLDATSRGAGNTINAATGAVTFVSGWSGNSTITATAAGCNGPDFATHTVTTTNNVSTPAFFAGSSSTRCQAGATTTYTAFASNTSGITYSLDNNSLNAGNEINSATGAVTWASTWSGTSVITASAAGCNGPTLANHTVTITPVVATPVFTLGATSSRCNGPGTVAYSATAATSITYSLDGASIAAGNTVNASTGVVTYVTGWVGTTTITATAAGCGTPSAQHLATSTANVGTPVFNLGPSSTRCQGAGSSAYTATASNSTGISYSLDAASLAAGNTINSANGMVTFVVGWTSPTVVTATATGCNGPSSATHIIYITGNGLPTFDMGSSSSRLQGAGTVTYTANANNGGTVTYSLDAASLAAGNTINASTGAVTYTSNWSGNTVITGRVNGCNGQVSASHTVTVGPSSVFKHLYLSDPSQALDRIDPVATADATTASTSNISSGQSQSFTQLPALCGNLVIKVGRNITVTNFVTISSGSMPANPNITAVLRYGANNIITLTNPTYSSATGLLTWVGTLPADVTVPAGQAITLTVTSNQTGVTFRIEYDSQTKPSKVELPVSTFIDIQSMNVYNAPYPGGSIITGGVSGATTYVRAVVSDPFGFADITGMNITFNPPGNTVTATSVATGGCTRTYEYVWNTPASSSYVNIKGVAKEGHENLVTASREVMYTNCVNCPPVALPDSAVGAGGTPLIVNVLNNDTDPNSDLNPNSLTVVTQPLNGNAIVSNGKIVYLPNGTFAGTDQFEYQVCDRTSPTPLCATALVTVSIDPTIVDPCGEAALAHIYYIPYPEQDAQTALIRSSAPAYLPIPSNNIRTIISLKVPYNGMTIVWDHWEDGYEENILSPQQSTTVVWGDGNPYNGVAPGYPTDIIPAGGSIVLDNTMNVSPRTAASIFYDGRDKIYSSGEISMAQVLGEPSIIGVQCMKTNITATTEFGKSFTIPVGEDFNSRDFRYTSLFIRASENNTEVNIDKDNNGTFETTVVLNEGQSLLVDGGVLSGATVTGSAPIGVDLHFGGVDGYSSREVPVFPATWYSNVYYTPVPTTKSPDTAVVMFYNTLSRALTINWSNGNGTSGTFSLPAKTTIRYPLLLSSNNTYKFWNPTGESFTAIEIVDSYTPGGGGNSGSTFDWSFNLIAEERLTTFATIAWAPGSTNGTRNDNPIWITPNSNTTVYVKYNGDVLTGGSLSPCGFRFDASFSLNALQYRRIFDNSDNDQSGIAIYTCNGSKIAAVYGEDPAVAQDANPSWDVGTTIKPYCAQKLIFANDDYAYSITDRAVTIPVLNNDAGFTATVDPATLSIGGLRAPKNGTVVVNPNGTLLYTPNIGFVGTDTLQYSVCSTPVPVCDVANVYIRVNGCPTPANQNIISGQIFLDRNKDGLNNDGGTGFSPGKVRFYVDGNCNGVIDAGELRDSAVVDNSGGYQFITFPERIVADDFSNPDNTPSCASGSDGNTAWASNWVDAGDNSVGFCVTPPQNYGNTDVEMIFDGAFGYALRIKDKNKSATRTVNLSGATAAYLSFSFRRNKIALGRDLYVQASTNGSTFTTIYTIYGSNVADLAYTKVLNLNLLPYASATTHIRFLTNGSLGDAEEFYIDDVSIQFLRYPICYITAIDPSVVPEDYYISTPNSRAFNVVNGGVCMYPYDYGIARRIVTVSGTLFNDVNGITDNLVNGIGSSGPAGNTVYAYLVDTLGKIELKTTVNGLTGVYSFTRAEVNRRYTVVLSTSDLPVGATAPSTANMPAGWVVVGDSYGTNNRAGTGIEPGTPNMQVSVHVGLFDVPGVNFGINQLPVTGNGSNSAINPGGTLNVTVPASTFSNIVASSDFAPGTISQIRISAFPANATSITINGIQYTLATFPAGGVLVPATATGQPVQTILVDPLNGMVKVSIPFFAVDNAGSQSATAGKADLQMLIDTDKDGIPDNIDIDDDNDGIPDVIEVCLVGATTFSCAPGGIDPALDNDGDGIVNWQDPDYGPLNANGCTAALDRDGDGIPDFLDLDSDNDGIPDVVEAYGADANGDGVIDNFTDTDGDGFSQNVDANNTGAANSGNGLGYMDLDQDGLANAIDLDSDGDGIPDLVEVLGTDANHDGRIDNFTDSDRDGLADAVDADADNDFIIDNPNGPLLKTGVALSNGRASGYPFKNADFVGRPNPYDLDSDNDGITDVVESGLSAQVGVSNGMVSGGRTNGWATSVQMLPALNLRNTDGVGPVDYLDIDSDDDGITDNIEAQTTSGYIVPVDTDTDGDGISNVYDLTPTVYGANGLTPYDNDGDGTPDYRDLDTDNDGALDINEASRYFTLTASNINTGDLDGDGLLDEFDGLNIASLAAGNMYRNHTNSNFGALGSYSGPLPSGSNAKMVKSDARMNDRDWRNIVVLPIQIVAFNGTYENNLVTLKWNVQNESEVSRYEVERSENGVEFIKIGTVEAGNRSNVEYTYRDDVASLTVSNVYYRVRQVSKSGQTYQTSVIKWKIERNVQTPLLYPNPVHDDLKIRFTSQENAAAEVIVFDGGGRALYTNRFTLIRGQNILTIPGMGRLAKGSYHVRFRIGVNSWMLRFLVQ